MTRLKPSDFGASFNYSLSDARGTGWFYTIWRKEGGETVAGGGPFADKREAIKARKREFTLLMKDINNGR